MILQMSLVLPHEGEDILLPPSTNFIKDLHFSPSGDGLVLFASLGKKLSILRWLKYLKPVLTFLSFIISFIFFPHAFFLISCVFYVHLCLLHVDIFMLLCTAWKAIMSS